MERINIDELKKNPAVVKVFGDRVQLRRESGELVGLCPFHAEKSGSFHVYQDPDGTWLYKCFGCAVRGGNAIQFVAAFDKVSTRQAIETVEKAVGGNWAKMKDQVDQTFRPAVIDQKEIKTYPLAEYAAYERALANNPAALEWLRSKRGIKAETALKLHLGFKQDVGRLAGEKFAHVANKGWISFPCIEGDRVVAIKYRSIVEKAFCKQPGMAKGDATPWFNAQDIDLFDPIFVVEGELDCAALTQAGFRAVSIQAAQSPVTPRMRDQIMGASCIILAGDCDGGVGSAVMEKLWRELGERTFLLRWPEGKKDANQTFLESAQGDVQAFARIVDDLTIQAKSQPMPDIYSLPEIMLSSRQTSLKDHPLRLHFPYKNVDAMAILLPGSVMGITATSTGQGKTAFVNEVCLYNARKHGEVIVNYQCELSTDEMATLNTANILRKDRNHLTSEDRAQAARLIRGIPYYIGNNPALNTIEAVLDLIEAAIRRLGATIAVLDHIHFLTANSDDEYKTQTNAINRIKRMAQQYCVKFIIVGQPRKSGQQGKGKKIHVTDVKGSESLTSSTDAFFTIHRDVVKNPDPDNPPRDQYELKTEIHLLKVRAKGEGAAMATLMFIGEFGAFTEIEYRNEDVAHAD